MEYVSCEERASDKKRIFPYCNKHEVFVDFSLRARSTRDLSCFSVSAAMSPHLRITFFFLPILSTYARPNPQASPVSTNAASATITPAPTSSYSFPSSLLYELTATDYTVPASVAAADSARYVSEIAAYASYISHFYATARPSDLALLSSERAAESSAYDDLTSFFYNTESQTLAPSDAKALSSAYAQWTSEEAVLATYTGTDDPFATILSTASVGGVGGLPTAVTAAAPTAAANWPALTQVQSPAAYGAHCQQYYSPGKNYDITQCDTTIPQICDLLAQSSNGTGGVNQWIYTYNSDKSCILGFWMPKELAGTDKVPSARDCQTRIYEPMVNLCIMVEGNGQDVSNNNAAFVNVDQVPGNGKPGTQVKMGSLSYMMAMT